MSHPTTPGQQAVELARDLVRIPSITAVTPDLRTPAKESLLCLTRFLSGTGAHCEWLSFEGSHARWPYPVDNLYIEWGNPAAEKRLCFIGHTDVVPPGDIHRWSRSPFSGDIENGFLFGRGTTDMKGAVAAFTVAAGQFARECQEKDQQANVSMIITSDEEWAAINGTCRVLDWARTAGKILPAFLVGEPSSEEHFGAAVKIGRRGSLGGQLIAHGTQGHAAYQGLYDNPNRSLIAALDLLHQLRWEDGNAQMPPTNFETIALESGDFGSSAIIPGKARALWNIRFTHRQTPSLLNTKLQEALANSDKINRNYSDTNRQNPLELIANIDTASLPYYSQPGRLLQIVAEAAKEQTGRTPTIDAKGGTTDGRFVHQFFPQAEIVEFGLPEMGGLTFADHKDHAGKYGGMHQADECCSIEDLKNLTRCYQDILRRFTGEAE